MGRMVRIKNIGVQSVIEKQENCSSGGITDSVPPTPVVLHDTVYLEVFVVLDDKLFDEVGRSYSNGKFNKYGKNPKLPIGNPSKESALYIRKFMTAVNSRFQNQFDSPKINIHISGLYNGKDLPYLRTPNDDIEAMDVVKTLEKMVFHYNETFRKTHKCDIVLLITGQQKLCSDYCRGRKKYKGYTYQNGTFYEVWVDWTTDTSSILSHGVAIVSDFGAFSGVNTAVRQFGYLLGATDNGYNSCSSDGGYIMSDNKKCTRRNYF